jgi:hypothetical protein
MSCRVSIIQASVLQYNCLSAVFQLYSWREQVINIHHLK